MKKIVIIFLFCYSVCVAQSTVVTQYLCYSAKTFSITNTVSSETVNLFQFDIPNNKTCFMTMRVTAEYTTGLFYFSSIFNKLVIFQNSNGVATIMGGTNLINPILGTGMSAISESESVLGPACKINVKGQVSRPLKWTILTDVSYN